MYNIAITKDKNTDFFSGNDMKPRSYPTLTEALVSAQYLGLAKQDVELHFVREGASVEAITETASSISSPGKESIPEIKTGKEEVSGRGK